VRRLAALLHQLAACASEEAAHDSGLKHPRPLGLAQGPQSQHALMWRTVPFRSKSQTSLLPFCPDRAFTSPLVLR
jgi:hypothetical protein